MKSDRIIDITPQARADLRRIYGHLLESYPKFGATRAEAVMLASRRIEGFRQSVDRLALAPHRGTRHDHLLPGLRSATFDDLAVWFTIDDDAGTVRVLAMFSGGQDQHARMLARLSPPQR